MERRTLAPRVVFFLLLAAVYGVVYYFLQGTSFFDVTLAHNDRLFSADDVYCALNFYAVPMDASARIIKHPLFLVLASALTWLEGLIFGPVSAAEHYGHIVLLQMGLSLLSTLYLERILRLKVGLSQRRALLLYYGEGLNMREIGEQLGLDKSTVSRTIQRGERRLRRCLRYGAEAYLLGLGE